MPNWKELLEEVKSAGSTHDVIRRKYLQELQLLSGRNVIVYYSGWLQKGDLQRQGVGGFSISDADKNGFMTAIHGMDRAKGLDLLLHNARRGCGRHRVACRVPALDVRHGYTSDHPSNRDVSRYYDRLCVPRNHHGQAVEPGAN